MRVVSLNVLVDSSEVFVSSDDDPPTMLGLTRHRAHSGPALTLASADVKSSLLRQVKLLESDHFKAGSVCPMLNLCA